MVNFGFNSASVLGILLALAGAGLFLLRSVRPEVSRDHDIVFAVIGLLCGFILLFYGWRLEPILLFGQLLLSGSAIFFAVESIRLRGVTTQQARGKKASYVDEERPVRRVYRAELEEEQDVYEQEYDYPEEKVPRRRLQGSVSRAGSRRGDYEEETPRPRPSRRSSDEYSSERYSSRPRRTTTSRRSSSEYVDWQDEPEAWQDSNSESRGDYDDYSRSPRPTRPPRRSSRKRRPKSADDIVSSVGTEYVDYQPLDSQEDNNDEPNQETPEDYDY
jgi:hypothetical protein